MGTEGPETPEQLQMMRELWLNYEIADRFYQHVKYKHEQRMEEDPENNKYNVGPGVAYWFREAMYKRFNQFMYDSMGLIDKEESND